MNLKYKLRTMASELFIGMKQMKKPTLIELQILLSRIEDFGISEEEFIPWLEGVFVGIEYSE